MMLLLEHSHQSTLYLPVESLLIIFVHLVFLSTNDFLFQQYASLLPLFLQCLALRQRAVETCVATAGAVSARSWVLAGSRGLDAPESGGRAAHLRSSTCPREPSRS